MLTSFIIIINELLMKIKIKQLRIQIKFIFLD